MPLPLKFNTFPFYVTEARKHLINIDWWSNYEILIARKQVFKL